MITMEAHDIQLRDRFDYQPCRAEIAECGCPDDCERDHANE
jgi:hypothetical protein